MKNEINTIWFYPLTTIALLFLLVEGCKKEVNEPSIPQLTTTSVNVINSTTATIGGNISDDGGATVTERGVCWSTIQNPIVTDSKATDGSSGIGIFTTNISGLTGNVNYYVRAYAINSAGIGYGDEKNFITSDISEYTNAQAATNINTTYATLNGIVNANNLTTQITFEYGESTAYGSTISATPSPVTGNENTNVSAAVIGLSVATTYHFRIKTDNSQGGTAFSSDITFTTLGEVPEALTSAATNMTAASVLLNGIVNANELETTITFEYGSTTGYGQSVTASQSPITGNINTDVSVSVSGLTAGSTYHYRVKAVNVLGTSYGDDMTFFYLYYGADYQGGLVFSIDSTGQHGLISASSDQSIDAEWGCIGTELTGANVFNVGGGEQNTIDIVNGCSTSGIAAEICYNLSLNSYDDWFLPSLWELELMYSRLRAIGLGDFGDLTYWSSSQSGTEKAWGWEMYDGDGQASTFWTYKTDHLHVRAIRAF